MTCRLSGQSGLGKFVAPPNLRIHAWSGVPDRYRRERLAFVFVVSDARCDPRLHRRRLTGQDGGVAVRAYAARVAFATVLNATISM
jgi:hypothetical protein